MQLVVRNTFISAVEHGEEELFRTVSAPTGSRSVDLPAKAVEHCADGLLVENASPHKPVKEMEFDSVSKPEDHPLSWLTSTPPPSPRSDQAHSSAGFAAGGKPCHGIVPDDLSHSEAASKSLFGEDSAAHAMEGVLVPPVAEQSSRHPKARGTRGGRAEFKKGNVLLGTKPLPCQPRRSSSPNSTASGSTDVSSVSYSSWPLSGSEPTIVHPHEERQMGQLAIPGAMFPVNTPLASGHVMAMAVVVPTLEADVRLSSTPSTALALHAATIVPATAFSAQASPVQMCSRTCLTTGKEGLLPGPCKMPATNMNNTQARSQARDALESYLYATPAPESMTVPAPKCPPIGLAHRWHRETSNMGHISQDSRTFTKQTFEGRLSVISEDRVHTSGTQSYAVRFTEGELSSADGVGFIFSSHLPCPKNIQRIVSIFANRTGRICVRSYSEVIRSTVCVKPLELGDLVTVAVDLDTETANFKVWPADGRQPSSATLAYGMALKELGTRVMSVPQVSSGYFACVVKNAGVTVSFCS